MKKYFLPLFAVLFSITITYGQKITGALKFEQGQTLTVTTEMKSNIGQQAMGQSIDFSVDGMLNHSFKVTNTTDDNSTLHHQVNQITFKFDGMGQKRSFDSKNEKDMNGQFGKPMKDVLDKTYDIIIDPTGKVLIAKPEKIQTAKTDDRLAIVTNLLKDLMVAVQPPPKNTSSFFKILPDREVGIGDSWNESYADSAGLHKNTYKLSSINDSTIVIDFIGSSNTISKAEMMGNETITTMNNKSTGTILLNKTTHLLKEKNIVTESTGNTEVMGGTLPVTAKITMITKVQ